MVKETQRHRPTSHHKVPQKYGGGRGGGWEGGWGGGGEEMTIQWQTQQPLGICHFQKHLVSSSSLLHCVVFCL